MVNYSKNKNNEDKYNDNKNTGNNIIKGNNKNTGDRIKNGDNKNSSDGNNNGKGKLIITRVEASKDVGKKLRVAAYARVSADKDAAFHSLESQADYYLNYVKAHAEWELVGIYSDSAISGTTIDRPEFQRLMSDCKAGRIDLIVTKSITRFARNTVALLETIRELKALDIDVYFEKENMHSISPDGELLLTLLAMYAEEEARSASENQRWRIKKKFEQGQTTVGRMLGYRLVDGVLTIVPEEAEVVRQIYKSFLNGNTIYSIVKTLTASGIPARFSDAWGASSVRVILTNEKYTGNLLLQKTYTPDFRTKKRYINTGQVTKYQVEGSHEAIISKDDYDKVQELLEQNRKKNKQVRSNKSHQNANQSVNNNAGQNASTNANNNASNNADRDNQTSNDINNDHPNQPPLFSGLITCGVCSHTYGRYSSNTGKYKHYVWACRRYNNLGKAFCKSKAIPERIMIEETIKVLEQNVPEFKTKYVEAQPSHITSPPLSSSQPLPPSPLPSPPSLIGLTNELLKEYITMIIVPSPNHLVYHLNDDRIIEIEWKHHSRRESWTPEMRQKARECALANYSRKQNNGKANCQTDRQTDSHVDSQKSTQPNSPKEVTE